MLEGKIQIGDTYVWKTDNPKTYKIVNVIDIREADLMKEFDILEEDENLLWIGFEDEDGNKAWIQEAGFREACIELNHHLEKIEPVNLKPPLTPSSLQTITLTIEIPAEFEEEFTEFLKESLGEEYNITRELKPYYHVKEKDSAY
ncbi:MAG: hypothetical protein ACM3SR_12010 [Ignavibacteriales bacterium]